MQYLHKICMTNDTNWYRSPDNIMVLIFSNEIRIQDGECRGDTKQSNNQNNLPHSLRYEEHKHDARTAGRYERQRRHEMGVLPHADASKGPKVADTDHVVLLHMSEQCGQDEGEKAGEHGKRGGANGVVGEGRPKCDGLQGEGKERGQGDHGGDGGSRGRGLRGGIWVAGGDER